jgi:predicted anti-sigma-YlaC factor YlaD
MVSEQIIMEAMIDRALELDASYDMGAIHSFLINYEMVRQGREGDPAERARLHFETAVDLSQGRLAGPYVTYAESVMVQKQDAAQFTALLERALAVDVEAFPEVRLVNLIMQDRARWLLSQRDELFLISPEP